MDTHPRCIFFQYYQEGRPPSRADRFASGTLSMRAVQYCDAVTAASGLGWWLFPPVDILLLWDGKTIVWSQDGEEWQSIDDTAHFPGFPEAFNAQAPHHLRGRAPPLLTALPEPGLIQVSLGLFARTAPGWSLCIRRPPNLHLYGHIEHFEGIVNTSSWFGPLFINLRITKTDVPVRLRADQPLAQAQPIPHALLTPQVLSFQIVKEIGPEDWEAYRISAVEPNTRPDRAFGAYAAVQRRNRKVREVGTCPGCVEAVE